MAASSPEWSTLLPDILGQVIACLPHIADRARFRAVCRLWRSALRLRNSHRRGLPWVVLNDGAYLTPSDRGIHRLRLPMNTRCIGSTNDWIVLDRMDGVTQKHTYALHNHFLDVAVLLPELNSIIGNVPEKFEIRKVLMRSTPDDLVAVTSNICRYPFILCRPGKGAWVAGPLAMPYFRIIDFAFLGDMLYVITKAESLYAIHLTEDDDGKPDVSFVERITRHTPYPNGDRYNNDMWMGTSDNDASSSEDEDDNYDALSQEEAPDELVGDASDIDDDNDRSSAYNCTLSDCEEVVNSKGCNLLTTYRHLVESHVGYQIRFSWTCSNNQIMMDKLASNLFRSQIYILTLFVENETRKEMQNEMKISLKTGSLVFSRFCNGESPPCNYIVKSRDYNMGYYLADGIYPRWTTFVKTISESQGKKQSHFTKMQEVARKDVKKAFGVLEAHWGIVRRAVMMCKSETLR
ncbi:hypothetical protein VPH35_118804 [Triticum aestivum]